MIRQLLLAAIAACAYGQPAPQVDAIDGLKYVWIPAGTFTMGCSLGTECTDKEEPPHQVTIAKGFWLGQTPVTVAAFARYAQATGASMPSEKDSWGRPANAAAGDGRLPAILITQEEAARYCAWAGKRLPTEAEWEWAARGGTTELRYGNVDEIAWSADNSGKRRLDSAALARTEYATVLKENGNGPHRVGEKKPNAYGLYDMLGNAWQWTAEGVPRGGSWLLTPRLVHASYRLKVKPSDRSHDGGFGLRCAGH